MKKQPGRDGQCKVTFELASEIGATGAHVCGDFNDWSPSATPMKRRKDGTLTATVTLETGRRYRFRYLLDDGRWENDWAADGYAPNDYGGDDSVVEV
ncbi:isoamylase early set domain-containing protein [Actinomarinicola tropica]|uniref:isoamylase early set domain-containing protein n=1 Tax=Actinomarinicola tropica TaxID=2789776 RepID=UPI001E2E3B0A|nr:isoamylase early set domain-containing protein [Actinomarinicola tropica]